MWKKIESTDILTAIHPGDTITQNPDDPSFEFQIQTLEHGYVSAIDTNRKEDMKFFPKNYLVYDKWWVKE